MLNFNQKCALVFITMRIINTEKDCGINFLHSTMKNLKITWLDLDKVQPALEQDGVDWTIQQLTALDYDDRSYVVELIGSAFVRGGNFNSFKTAEYTDQILSYLNDYNTEYVPDKDIPITKNDLKNVPIEDLNDCIITGYLIIFDYVEKVFKCLKYTIDGTLEILITRAMNYLCQYVHKIELIRNPNAKEYDITQLINFISTIPDFQSPLSKPHISSYILYKSGIVQSALDSLQQQIEGLIPDYNGINYFHTHYSTLFKGWDI